MDYRGVGRIFPEGCTASKINLIPSPESFLSDLMGTVIITFTVFIWQFILLSLVEKLSRKTLHSASKNCPVDVKAE